MDGAMDDASADGRHKAYRLRRNRKKCGVVIGKRWVVSLWSGRHAQNRFRSKIAFSIVDR